MFHSSKWQSDDGNAVGCLDHLKLFNSLKKHGPTFGHHPTECHIITKEHLFEKAHQIFFQHEVEIVDCCRVLGSVIVPKIQKRNL